MRFEWDRRKNRANIRKHGIDFTDAQEIFEGPMLTSPDDREDYVEDRWAAIGLLRSRIVVAVFTEPEPDLIRIISIRKALRHERKQLEKAIRNRLV
ncbi:MAG: BrnT family toxin [Acidobacteriota bacterium]